MANDTRKGLFNVPAVWTDTAPGPFQAGYAQHPLNVVELNPRGIGAVLVVSPGPNRAMMRGGPGMGQMLAPYHTSAAGACHAVQEYTAIEIIERPGSLEIREYQEFQMVSYGYSEERRSLLSRIGSLFRGRRG